MHRPSLASSRVSKVLPYRYPSPFYLRHLTTYMPTLSYMVGRRCNPLSQHSRRGGRNFILLSLGQRDLLYKRHSFSGTSRANSTPTSGSSSDLRNGWHNCYHLGYYVH